MGFHYKVDIEGDSYSMTNPEMTERSRWAKRIEMALGDVCQRLHFRKVVKTHENGKRVSSRNGGPVRTCSIEINPGLSDRPSNVNHSLTNFDVSKWQYRRDLHILAVHSRTRDQFKCYFRFNLVTSVLFCIRGHTTLNPSARNYAGKITTNFTFFVQLKKQQKSYLCVWSPLKRVRHSISAEISVLVNAEREQLLCVVGQPRRV